MRCSGMVKRNTSRKIGNLNRMKSEEFVKKVIRIKLNVVEGRRGRPLVRFDRVKEYIHA